MASPTAETLPPGAGSAAPNKSNEKADEKALPRPEQAKRIIRRNVYWALGAGLIPLPVIDLLGISGVQVKMIKSLSDVYGIKFSENTAKTVTASLLAGLGSVSIAGAVSSTLFKFIPVVGQLAGIVTTPIFAGAFTQALGNVFVMHFESGGTLLNFDPEKMRHYFRQEFDKAKETVKQVQKEEKTAGPNKPAVA